jgi:hypothetical protein
MKYYILTDKDDNPIIEGIFPCERNNGVEKQRLVFLLQDLSSVAT